MKFILSLILVLNIFLANPAYSITPVDSPEFEGANHASLCADAPSYIDCLDGNWYLDYIGMPYIYSKNVDILYTDFTVAILDTAIDTNHEDLDSNIIKDISFDKYLTLRYPILSGYKDHGNLVTSLFSGGVIANQLGGRGIVNTKTLFLSATSVSDLLDSQNQNVSIGYNEITVLEGIDRLLNPSQTSLNQGYTKPKIISLSVGVSPKTEIATKGHNFNQGAHFKAIQVIRDYIEQNSGVLFVMLAHNQSTDAKKSNGALHYKYIGDQNIEQEMLDENNYVLNKLSNLIIVAANGPDNILHGSSNFGESVDISAPSGVYSASCVTDSNVSMYRTIDGTYGWYGYSFSNVDYLNLRDSSGDDESSSLFYETCVLIGNANGTSTATPITAGTAALLLSNDISLQPDKIKNYLVNTPNLVKTNLRYNGYYYLTEILAQELPILNIEKSMKQYEADHTIVEDFENFINFENSNEFINTFLNYNYQNNDFNVATTDSSPNIYFMGVNYPGNPFNSNAIGAKLSSGVRFGNGNINHLSFDITTVGGNVNINITDTNGNILETVSLSTNIISHIYLNLSNPSYVYITGISGDLDGIVLIDNMNVETGPMDPYMCSDPMMAQMMPEMCSNQTFTVDNTNFFGTFDDYTITNGPGNYLYNGVIYQGYLSLSFMSTGKLNEYNKCGSRCARVYLDNATIIFPHNIKKLSFSTVVQSPQWEDYGDVVFQLVDQDGNILDTLTTNCSGLTNHQVNIPINSQVKSVFFKRVSGEYYINLDNMSYTY